MQIKQEKLYNVEFTGEELRMIGKAFGRIETKCFARCMSCGRRRGRRAVGEHFIA